MWFLLVHTCLKYNWNVHIYCQTLWQRHTSIFLNLSSVLRNVNCIFLLKNIFSPLYPTSFFSPNSKSDPSWHQHLVKFRVAYFLCLLYSVILRKNCSQTTTKLQYDQPLNLCFLLHGVHANCLDVVLLPGQSDWPILLALFACSLPSILHPHVPFLFCSVCEMLVSESILVLSV